MEQPARFYYDQSFEGFLTACSRALSRPGALVLPGRSGAKQEGLFQNEQRIRTDRNSAMDLWNTLGQKGSACQRLVYFAFLSEQAGVERKLLEYIRKVLGAHPEKMASGLAEPPATLVRWAGQVASERRRLEDSLRFQSPLEGVFTGVIAPQYNVLPLLSRQFRNRFRSHSWLVYDRRRGQVLWGREGSPLFLERLAHCPAAVRALVRGLDQMPDSAGERMPLTLDSREPGYAVGQEAYASPRPGKAKVALQEAV